MSAASSPARRRADAQRNIEAILDAALVCLTADRHASVADIAQQAGVGRMTLYGHFRTRADLLEAVFARLLAHCEEVLGGVDLDGDPGAALRRLVGSSWQLVHQFHAVRQAAELELPEERIRAHHDQPMRRVEDLISRGRDSGAFRRDLPTSWLITVVYSILHAAADDCAAGRLDTDQAPHVITATLLSVLAAPADPR
ncbi:TetR/AcrR family transcriptional regulator [Dactylosporangium sp. AC04546]|uniref:TetR/AcrR family transcriptional regulator n=1 Tax=Dactylosporangium sp. AC04546 TaxID=2862460 RepID=UPI001EDE8AEA|nr:TetR/AcrR family transcriptional regulator [Dactylosporangium sp. AC04546]WVK79341.1 TetR/AcrR family transcriptional regulator [Dactylosporangium sp. AC04546]